jgi:ribosomal protein L18
MKRKLTLIGIITLVLVLLAVWAVPVFAADPQQAPQITQANKARVLVRLLLVQNEAKVDAFIAKAKDVGKLTAEQAVKVKEFWTAHHTQFLKNIILGRLLRAKDQSKVQAFLDKAVTAGKLQPAQADKIIQIWVILHTPVSASATQ